MAQEQVNRNELEIIRDFNDAADGLEDRQDVSAFITAGDRLARRFGGLMLRARTGVERAELLQSMAGVLNHFAQQNFTVQDGARNYEITTRILQRLGEAFVENLRADTIPEYYHSDQLVYISSQLKSAAKVREDVADYLPNLPPMIGEQGRMYRRIAENIDRAAAQFGASFEPAPLPSSRPGRGDRPVRTRF